MTGAQAASQPPGVVSSRRWLALCLALGPALALPSACLRISDDLADEPGGTPAAPTTAAELIDRHITAIGGAKKLEALASVAATAPPIAQANPLEDMVREMLRPILKQWLDDHLPNIVDEHVKREIHRITGRPL